MWLMPGLPFWEDKGLAVAPPGMLKLHLLSPNRRLLFSYKIQMLGGGVLSFQKISELLGITLTSHVQRS